MINNILNIMYPGMGCRPRKIRFCGDNKHIPEMEKTAEILRGQLVADLILPQASIIDVMSVAIKHMLDVSDADMIIAFANESNDLASKPVLFCQMDWVSGIVVPDHSNSFNFSTQLNEYGFKFGIATVYEIVYAAGNHKPILVIPTIPILDINDEVIGSSTRWSGEIPLVRVYDNP